MRYEVEKDIPFVDKSRLDLYPFDIMEVGDSFHVPVKENQQQMDAPNPVLSAMVEYNKFHSKDILLIHDLDVNGKKNEQGRFGIRFWRIK